MAAHVGPDVHRPLTQTNRPRFHALLLERAGVSVDRALFPLLSRIELGGPLGVVELAESVKLNHSTVEFRA